MALSRCEPESQLALPDPAVAEDQYKIISALSDLCDRELVATIGWAKQVPGRGRCRANRSLQGGRSDMEGQFFEV